MAKKIEMAKKALVESTHKKINLIKKESEILEKLIAQYKNKELPKDILKYITELYTSIHNDMKKIQRIIKELKDNEDYNSLLSNLNILKEKAKKLGLTNEWKEGEKGGDPREEPKG